MVSKRDQVYLTLKRKLINCEYAPGSVLTEAQLVADFGLSRTPIREALSLLEADGYIKILPKKGIFVAEVSVVDVMQIFQTRLEVEPLALKLAHPHLERERLLRFKREFEEDSKDLIGSFHVDTEMHLYVIEKCGNHYLIDMMRKVFDDNTRIIIATRQNERKIHNARLEHLKILESILRHDDVEKTAELLRSHIMNCRTAAMDSLMNPSLSSMQ